MIDRIDAAHRFLACLLFDNMRAESGRERDHEDAVECRGIIPSSARIAPMARRASQAWESGPTAAAVASGEDVASEQSVVVGNGICRRA